MNVLVFHQYYVTPEQAGSTRMYYFIRALLKRGHEVTLITGGRVRRQRSHKLVETFRPDPGFRIVSIDDGYHQQLGFFKRLTSFIKYALFSTFLGLECNDFDVIFASSTPLMIGLPALVVSRMKKKPYLFEVRDLWPDAPVSLGYLKNPILIRFASWFERCLYAHASHIIALSSGIKAKVEKRTDTSVSFIPNSVDDCYFDDRFLSENKKSYNNKIQVIYAGSCGHNNAIYMICELVNRIKANKDVAGCVEFTIVGDGKGLDPYRNDLNGKATLTGVVAKDEVLNFLSCSDIGLYTQKKIIGDDLKKDSLPNKLFDYIGAELSVLAAIEEDGEAANLINAYGLGVVVSIEDIDALERALISMLFDLDSVKRQQRAAASAKQFYSRSSHAEQFCGLLEKVSCDV